jgi:asparagine synthase (glutamine-hydrolysing)
MCGIVGCVQVKRPVEPRLFSGQCSALHHRGPDDCGAWISADGCVALGNQRLAIQDLSGAGHMPMSDESGQVWITFNGEIYNFQKLRAELEGRGFVFRSGSDTEVILNAYLEWGTACLDRLNGMFGFAIYDCRRQRTGVRGLTGSIDRSVMGPYIFLARDRAGEKPLYYWHHSQGLSFASELKALMVDPDLPRHLSLSALNAFLTFGYVPGEMCILEGVKKLPPAHALTYHIETESLRTWRYWSLPGAYRCDEAIDSEGIVDELIRLLGESVRLRCVADVPVGILLSGGIDSSLVAAMAARYSSRPIKTFTITFPGHGVYDEGPFARKVSEHFATDHHELVAEPATVDLLPELVRYFDEPLADSSLVPTFLVSRLTRQYVTVALGGDGGDELFGGYLHYRFGLRMRAWLRAIPQPLRTLAARSARYWLPIGLKGRHFLSGLGGDLGENIISACSLFDPTARYILFTEQVRQALAGQLWQPEHNKLQLWRNGAEPVNQMTRLDFATYLPDDILMKVDRASMAVSLEVRAPWLDQQIVEFAFARVPGVLKVTPGEGKILLRRMARQLLPADLDLDRKQGFSLPLSAWFRGDWGAFCADILRKPDGQIFNPRTINRLLTGQRWGLSNTSRLFALMMFELWRQQYRVELS